MKEKIRQTLKSTETEDWLDYHVIRPICYYCARAFAALRIHPNTVTILSMFFGAGSCLLYAHGSWYYEGAAGLLANLMAVVLLMVADILDCTDGQLARMTGQKSRIGRILDGMAGFVWFVPIYIALVWRFYQHHTIEFGLLGIDDTPRNAIIATIVVMAIAIYSGVAGLARQQRLADYYIQVHLFFLKGEKDSEFDNSERQQQLYEQMGSETSALERWFQHAYVDYTRKQEAVTPMLQRLVQQLRTRYGSTANIPQELRDEFLQHSRPLMTWNGLLTFNFRSFWFFLFCLTDIPVANFLFEIIVMGMLTLYVNRRHEGFCRQIANRMK